MGKAGLVGDKISATLASTGTPSFFLHPAEALHGDLGRLREEDVCLLLSNSGETGEVASLIDPLKRLGCRIVAMTGARESRLARHADIHLFIGKPGEACPMGLAPTSTTTAMLALGDALAMVVLDHRGFGREDYARFHPGGSLGRKLMKVDDVMRRGDEQTIIAETTTASAALLAINQTHGRPGAASIIDGDGRLCGFVTDGDLVRTLQHGTEFLERPVAEMMTRDPKHVASGSLVSAAMHLLHDNRIDQLPVVDDDRRPVGLVDVQDLVDMGFAST